MVYICCDCGNEYDTEMIMCDCGCTCFTYEDDSQDLYESVNCERI